MKKKKTNKNLVDYLDELYHFLKYKLNFDEFQAITTTISIVVLPIIILLGFKSDSQPIFKYIFYFNILLIVGCITHTILKIRKNKLIITTELQKPQTDIRKIKNIDEIDALTGIDFERFVAYMFQKKGYRTEMTKQTHDRGADVIAEKGKECLIIQVKRSNNSINKNAVFEAFFARRSYQGTSACVVTNSELTAQAMNFAHENSILIIDRSRIRKFLRSEMS